MISVTKVKELRKHKRKEKNGSFRNVSEDTNANERSEFNENIPGESSHVEKADKDECYDSVIDNLEIADGGSIQIEAGDYESHEPTPPKEEITIDVSFTLDNINNITIDKSPKKLCHHESVEPSMAQIERDRDIGKLDSPIQSPESEFQATNYNSYFNELLNDPEVDGNNISGVASQLTGPKTTTPLSEKQLAQYYYNSKMNEVQEYVAEFVQEEINFETKVVHPLYILMSNYVKANNNLQVNEQIIKKLDEKLDFYVSEMWTVCDKEIHEQGKCMDRNLVTLIKKFTQAKFNQQVFDNFTITLAEIKSTLFETFKIDSFNCLKYKLKIEQYIQSLLTSCPEFSNLNESSGFSFVRPSSDSYFLQCLSKLRTCIGILILFQRKEQSDITSSIVQESRQWLSDLIGVLIRVGNLKDHVFILNHILRCPGGVGQWGSYFVQFPRPSIGYKACSDAFVNHTMAMMLVMLQPVEKREEFINEWNKIVPLDENSWVLIDSEDEDDETMSSKPLKENDLMLLLNQIPLRDLFSSVLGLINNKLNPCDITPTHLIKLFSFSLDFIKVIHNGLQAYSTQRFKQFAKRLGQLLLHVIEYATYELELFKSKCKEMDHVCLERLQVEYDNFFLKSAKCIFSSRIHGTWQFLAVVPYNVVSRSAIMELYFGLQLKDENAENNYQFSFSDFAEKFHRFPESEQFFLLSTFASMALARDLTEWEFIQIVVHQLLYIGFLSPLTKDKCYKSVKSLLSNVCDRHPFLISEILRLENKFFEGNENEDLGLSVYLWKDLPIKIWKPNITDLTILSSWLKQPLKSIRSELARIILKSLNYGIDQGELFLPLDIHKNIANIILEACVIVPQDQRNVIENVSTFVRLHEPEQSLQSWSWNVLFKLRLHLLDQSPASVKNALENLNDNLRVIRELESVKELHKLVQQKNPIACFIALMTTTVGHSVPLIFEGGFSLLEVLIQARKSEAAIVCMEFMTLMFLDCLESLYRCQNFTSVLSHLITSDYSYLKLANNLKQWETPHPILLSLGNMIQNQITLCDNLCIGQTTVIELWVKSLTKIPFWMKQSGVVYLLDLLCKNAFFCRQASAVIKEILTESILHCSSPAEAKPSLSSLASWMNNRSTTPTMLPRSCNGNAVWYFLVVIEIEQELYENGNFLWIELLKELSVKNNQKTNIDSCLKKACSNLQIPSRTSEVLTIYRLCYQILETRPNHPVMIILWQKFFLLYFQRIPGFFDNGSVGAKFFHGFINQNLLKKLKQKLEETLDSYTKLHAQSSKSNKKVEFYAMCADIMHAFRVWLEEAKLHEPHVNVHLLPSYFNSDLLSAVINQNTALWIKFVDHTEVQNEISKCILAWQEKKNRRMENEIPKSPFVTQEKSLTEKIEDGLLRYQNPLPAPSFDMHKYSSLRLAKEALINSETMVSYLRPSFRHIQDYADCQVQEIGEYVRLSGRLKELVKLLYSSKTSSVTSAITCDGYKKLISGETIFFKCSGPAVITLSLEESELDKKSNHMFYENLRNFSRCLSNSLLPLQQTLGLSVITLEKSIDELRAEYLFMRSHSVDEKMMNELKGTGTRLFYEFVEFWTESVMLVPNIMALFESCVDSLGKIFITENPLECDHLLNVIEDHPNLVNKLYVYFQPNCVHTQDFIELYSKVKKCDAKIKKTLLSMFDLTRWLTEKRPRFAERSLLISEIRSGLKSLASCPPDELDLVKLFNTHLQQLLLYDFPEHYGEILNLLLEGSESQTIPLSTWFMFLNAIAPEGIHFEQGKCDENTFEPGQLLKKLKLNFTQYATHQRLLSVSDVRETVVHLGNHFKRHRWKDGLHGLYPKYRNYIEPIFIFCGMMSHSYVAETLKMDLGSLSMSIIDKMWPLLRDLYSPWLVPYWSKHEKSQTAKCIQELTDDRCVLLPWVNSDSSHASYACSIFMDSVKFVLDTIPGINNIMSHVWFFYVVNYAHVQVKDHILCVMHKNLLLLPWWNFFPTLQDIELMVKVIEKFIPKAHSLLGNIFVQIRWTNIVAYYSNQSDEESLRKLLVYLLHLLVKLPGEPTLKQSDEIMSLLTEAKDYSWHLIDSNSYDNVLNWLVISCNPKIVLMDEKSEYYYLDSLILQILRTCAGYVDTGKEFHPTTVTKRLMYVRASNKWLVTANSRFKCKDSILFKSAVSRILNEIESTVYLSISESQKTDEVIVLLSEFLNVFKETDLSTVLEQVIVEWLSTKRNITLIYGLLRSITFRAIKPEIFGNIAEACLDSYFDSNENSTWEDISKFVTSSSDQNLQKALISNNNILTFYAILFKHYNEDTNLLEYKSIISDVFNFLTSAQHCELLEPKLLLLIIHVCKISEIVGRFDESEGVSILLRLSSHLVNYDSDRKNWILSTFGLKKKEAFSTSFKFICLVASSGIMKLIEIRYSEYSCKIDRRTIQNLEEASADTQYSSISQHITNINEEMKKLESVDDVINILRSLGLSIFNKNYLK